jgi:putative inorganic carbon (hco3(-)) transporter
MRPDKKKTLAKSKNKVEASGKAFDVYSLILLVYAIAPVITPNLGALDSSVSKFLILGIINLAAYMVLVFRSKSQQVISDHHSFFSNPLGISYALFLFITLLAFTKAINVTESIVQFCQLFTIFYCTLILMMILKKDKKYFEQLSVILMIVLAVDCLTVFYGIASYINGTLQSISGITSIYSNKNILASAVFVKIPFVLWLQLYGSKKWRILTYLVLFMALLATFLLSTRVFYLGIGALTVLFTVFNLWKYLKEKNKNYLKQAILFPVILAISILLLVAVQSFLYPTKRDSYGKNVTERLESISSSESSVKHRLESWTMAKEFIQANPLLGVGPGNWKIAEIEKEGPAVPTYKRYMIHTHNDFLEVTTETGIPAGIVYLMLFLIPLVFFFMTFRSQESRENQQYMFLPAFGIFCYSFDAMINFPLGRPEIQLVFAVFLAAALRFEKINFSSNSFSPSMGRIVVVLTGILTIPVLFIIYNAFISARVQRIAQEELLDGKLVHSSGFITNSFPGIPEISVIGEPISVIKSRYLIQDGKFDEAIHLLRNDKSSPYDGRQELMLAAAYERVGNKDSVLFYAKKMLTKKPLYYEVVAKVCYLEMAKGQDSVAFKTMKNYLAKVDTNAAAWGYYSYLFQQAGNMTRSKSIVDSALKFMPNDSLLNARKAYLENVMKQVK